MKKAKFEFIDEHRGEFGVSAMCRVLGVTRQGYHQWLARPVSAHDLRDAELAAEVAEAYGEGRRIYGAPKVLMRLRARGVPASRKRVARLMRENGMRGVTRACAKRPTGEKRASRQDSHEDLVGRDFTADGPNGAWFAGTTYVRTRQGWLHLAIVMDVWSRMIVGWSMGPLITAELADDALRMAIARRRPAEGRMRHSDHGAQRVGLLLGKTMRENGIRPSMGAISSPWDNAVTESLMGVIKSECVHARTFEGREQATLEIFEYIECFYNRVRIHSAIGWMSPADYEARMSEKAAEAA